jgi:hypothetical protein
MSHRPNLNSLSASARTALVNLMLTYLTDAVVNQHPLLNHSGDHLFKHHRTYIADMELWLAANGGDRFVPLPQWDPATPIPPEFNVVRQPDAGGTRPPLQNLNPNMPKPAQFAPRAVCDFADADALGNAVSSWHGGVHGAVGGTFGMFNIASAAPIFWPWHGFVDEIYDDYLRCRWSGWEDLGGVITSGPAVSSWDLHRLDCFARGTNARMYHKWWNGSSWSGWEDLGGLIIDRPAAVSWGPHRIDTFVRGLNNHMFHKWWNGSSWSGWEDLGGIIVAGPAVASWGANRLDCFVTGTNNHMYHKWWNGSRWSGWEDLGGVIIGSPAAVSWWANRIDCVVTGTNNRMYHKWWDGSSWSGWEDLRGTLTAGPAVASWAPNRLDCFSKGPNNAVFYKWSDFTVEHGIPGSWSGWHSLGGVIDNEPAAVSWGPERIDCFVRGMNNHMYHKWWS